MKNKKGFTLIEIIVSISLMILIGIGSFFTINLINKKEDNNLEKLINAANVYLNIETDENGITYENGLLNGGVGVSIPIKVLLQSGYITEDYVKTLEKYEDGFNRETSYLLAAIYSTESSECNGNMISFTGNWSVSLTEPVYICPYSIEGETKKQTLYNKIFDDFENNGLAGCIPGKENGLCLLKGSDKTLNNKSVYYYTGYVENNYVKIGDELFNIIRTTEDGNVKLVYSKPLSSNSYSKRILGLSYDFVLSANRQNDAILLQTGTTKDRILKYTSTSLKPQYSSYYPRSYTATCVENCEFSNWKDSHYATYKVGYYANNYATELTTASYEMQQPLYLFVYERLNNWFHDLGLNEKDYIIDYKWCDKTYNNFAVESIENLTIPNFICKKELTDADINKFGLLTGEEYSASINYNTKKFAAGSFSGSYLDSEYGSELTSEYDSSNIDAIKTTHQYAIYYYKVSEGNIVYQTIGIRPAIVVDGDTVIIDGDGTKDNPYILS